MVLGMAPLNLKCKCIKASEILGGQIVKVVQKLAHLGHIYCK